MHSQSQDRLDRVEQLLVRVAEQTAANTQGIHELQQVIRDSRAEFAEQAAANAQGLRDLQQVVSETRSDLAHFVEWAEEVTQMIVRITALQERQERALEEMRQYRVEADQRFYVLLEEVRYLIRRQDQPQEPPSNSD
ncbi:MAG: hypothetical protein SNJ68_14265 [Cyanobacteriota bacterium]